MEGWAMGIPQIGTCGATALAYGSSHEEVVEIRRQSRPTLIPRGRALFWEGEHQPQKITIVEGVIRAVRLLENGNRQILAFYWPGDVVMPTDNGRSSNQLPGAAFGGFGHLPTGRTLRRPSDPFRDVGSCRYHEPEEKRRPNCGLSLAHSESLA